MKTEPYDLIISGGGMVGASLACAMAAYQFRVALIEAIDYGSTKQPSFDNRALALTYSSGQIFRNLGVWTNLSNAQATPIRYIEVSDEAAGGCVRLQCQDVGQEALGWNVAARAMGNQLFNRLDASENIFVFSPMVLQNIKINRDGVRADVARSDGQLAAQLYAKLLIVADGSNSSLSERFDFHPTRIRYRQSALVCRVETERANRGGAFEHFTRSGPLALLPFGETGYSVVWTQEPDELKKTMQQSRQEFIQHLQQRMGHFAGPFQMLVGERKTYPLTLGHLKKFVRPRIVVVGNASHTVHPVAGQGFNLALRDVAALAQLLKDHRKRGWDIGNYDVLVKYERWRIRESNSVTGFTDSMIRIFANDRPGLTHARSWGLDLLRTLPPVKRRILQRTMGLYGKQPQLATDDPDTK